MIKQEYNIGDSVWIHGVGTKNNLTKGKVIAIVDLTDKGYIDLQYVIEIPTHIEPLLEVRSWHTISQDEKGPIGSFRNLGSMDKENKKMSHLGFKIETEQFNDDPTPDEIMAALEKSTNDLVHKPLHIKDHKPTKRKYYPRKKK